MCNSDDPQIVEKVALKMTYMSAILHDAIGISDAIVNLTVR